MMKTLIDKLENERDLWDEVYIPCDIERQEVLVMIDDAINGCIDIVKSHSDWVPCSERLPEPDTTVLVYEDFWKQDTRIITARLLDGEFLAYPGWHKTVNVTHWCELPQPPREVQNG